MSSKVGYSFLAPPIEIIIFIFFIFVQGVWKSTFGGVGISWTPPNEMRELSVPAAGEHFFMFAGKRKSSKSPMYFRLFIL